jgi:hypothetical protein
MEKLARGHILAYGNYLITDIKALITLGQGGSTGSTYVCNFYVGKITTFLLIQQPLKLEEKTQIWNLKN